MSENVVTTDEAIEQLGLPLLRELSAIRWFCDAGPDGKMRLIFRQHRDAYSPGGSKHPLVATGCIHLYADRRAVRMEQFGRRVLERAYGMGRRAAIEADEPGEAA